jgi:plastocyanin
MTVRKAAARATVAALLVLALVLLVACGGGTSARDASPVASGSVVTKDRAFQPPHIQVPARTTVTFTNADQIPHQVKFDDGPQSARLSFGATFQRVFDTPGTYDYVCTIHSEMVGRVTVTSR